MTTLHLAARTGIRTIQQQKQEDTHSGDERREYRRYETEHQSIRIDRWNGNAQTSAMFGDVMDISAGGVRVRTRQANLKCDNQIRVRLEMPAYSGICPFVDTSAGKPVGKREWVGWMTVARVDPLPNGQFDVAGRLVDMEEMDRGMLGLYLSTQPLAA
jgi:hypothetical protein